VVAVQTGPAKNTFYGGPDVAIVTEPGVDLRSG
jgi:hypothetical protein